MKKFVRLAKLKPGDQVAVISPSAGLPGIFPWVQDLGLERLRSELGLVPKEYPTTRQMGSSLADRAKDVMAAFADPDNKAVFTSIGGDDQIKLLKFLDPAVLRANPKPFFGFSDNTNLHLYLWNLGIPSFYGGAIMTQFAMQGGMMGQTVRSLKQALFQTGQFVVEVAKQYNDEGLNWADPKNLDGQRKMEPNDGLIWDGQANAEGILWGGCAESLIGQVSANKFLPTTQDLQDTVLFLETAEDIPEHWIIQTLLVGFGERGWLDQFKAILVGRPKAWEFDKPNNAAQKAEYRQTQRQIVIETVRQYNTKIPIVQNLDFGHTDPQIILPMGGRVMVDTKAQSITLEY